MASKTFGSLMSGQMFLIPKGGAGDRCLWVKTGAKSAHSSGRSNYGSCAFDKTDPIVELSTYKVVELILEHKESLICRS